MHCGLTYVVGIGHKQFVRVDYNRSCSCTHLYALAAYKYEKAATHAQLHVFFSVWCTLIIVKRSTNVASSLHLPIPTASSIQLTFLRRQTSRLGILKHNQIPVFGMRVKPCHKCSITDSVVQSPRQLVIVCQGWIGDRLQIQKIHGIHLSIHITAWCAIVLSWLQRSVQGHFGIKLNLYSCHIFGSHIKITQPSVLDVIQPK